MADNSGLIGGFGSGLGAGLESFANSYMKSKAYNDDLEQKKQRLAMEQQAQQAGLIEKGVAQNDQGQMQYNPDLDPNIARAKVTGDYGLQKEKMMADVQSQRLAQMLGIQQQRLGMQEGGLQQRASSAYNKEIGPLETQILQADKIKGVLGKAIRGEITPSSVLSSEIAGSLNTMFTGKPSTVTGMSEAEYKSAKGNFNNLAGFITGDPKAAVTPQQLQQYLKEVEALQGEYLDQHKRKFSSFQARQPENFRPLLNNSYNTFRDPYDSKQGSGQGMLQSGISKPALSSEDQQAVQWATANKNDPRAQKILQLHGM